MNANTRACVAYIAAGLCVSRNPSAVYDYSQSKHVSIGGTVNGGNVNIYDHERMCHVSGSGSSLYDYGNSAHIQLNMNGSQFSGYDYSSSSYFSGSVRGSSISIYDYESSSYYNYSV